MIKFFPRFLLKTYSALVLLAIGLGVVLAPASVRAGPAEKWQLSVASGQVRLVKSGLTPIALTVGDEFTLGDWIETGPDGRAVLQRGTETIVVAPNSRIGLPENNDGPFLTRILQTLGTILLTIDKKANQHFEVQTPYMAAVVKGTTFTVGIQGQRAVVHVIEGLVEVRNLNSGLRSLVRPGQTGSVFRRGDGGVNIEGAQSNTGTRASATSTSDPVQNAAADSGSVTITKALGPSEMDLTTATGGLVREVSPEGLAEESEDESSPITSVSASFVPLRTDLAATLVFNDVANTTGPSAGGGSGDAPPPPPPPP